MTEESGKGRCYVDNAMNRSLGRAGMPLGSMVISSKGSSASSSSASYFGSSQSDGGRTYVDNYMNRGLGRVGMPLGSMVVSNRGNSSSLFDDSGICLPSSNSERTYVDNYMNREFCRVGMPLGSMVVSSRGNSSYPFYDSNICLPSSYSEQTYVDNYMNRTLGHFGMPLGSNVVYSRENSLFDDNDIHRRSLESGRSYEDHWMKKYIDQIDEIIESRAESSKESNELYPSREVWDHTYALSLYLEDGRRRATNTLQWLKKYLDDQSKSASKSCTASSSIPKSNEDNKYNQGLGGVSRSEACPMTEFRKEKSTFSSVSSRESSASSHKVSDFSSIPSCKSNTSTYIDDAENGNNRLLGMPVGSKHASKSKGGPTGLSNTHVDNEYNRRLGRVGKEHGSIVVPKESGIISSNRRFEQADLPYGAETKDKNFYEEYSLNRKSGHYGLSIKKVDPFETESIKGSGSFSSVPSREGSASVLNDTSDSKKKYVDSPLNRNRERIDTPFGSKPVSKPKSRSSSSPKTSVDNEYNQRLGKIGMKHGSMVVSKDSGTASFKETKQYTDYSKSKSSSSCKKYVDNEYNRDLGRVGLKHGSIVESKDSVIAGSKEINQHIGLEHDSMVESKDLEYVSSTGMKHYVDNSTNRRHRRVGLPDGANAEEVRAYKDNLSNRRLGRYGQPIGVAVQSNSGSLEAKFYVDNAHNRRLGRVGYPLGSRPYGVDSEEVVYKNNISNQKLERAKLPRGTAVQSKSRNLQLKFYVDNAKNRRLGRVGYPLGCKPESSFTGSKRTYCDNYLNRQLGRVGKELGTEPMICRKKMEWLHKAYQQCRENPDGDIDFQSLPTLSYEEKKDAEEHLTHLLNRLQLEREWQEMDEQTRPVPNTSDYLLHYMGPIIDFSDINLGKIIGRGGFGVVYYGKYKGSVVAIKVLNVMQVNECLQKVLFDEVNTLSKLENQFIVQFIGAYTKHSNLCIVLEYMQMSLHEALYEEGVVMDDFTDYDRLKIIIQTLKGLSYLHNENVAHCDISSRNILIDHDGKKFTVAKLTDFGLSKLKDDRQECHLGTPLYSSPERLRGEYLNLKKMKMSDMYSYGLVVFEILCGVHPFRDFGFRELHFHVGCKNMYPKFPDDIHPNVHLSAKLQGCWDRKPEKRPTATDFLKVMNRMSCVYKTED